MDWFLYDIGLRHERVNYSNKASLKTKGKNLQNYVF